MFLLKKVVSILLFLFPLSIVALAVGLGLARFTKRQRAGRILTTAGFVGLLAVSCDPLADLVVVPLENDHPPLFAGRSPALDREARAAKHIVVLGAGYTADRTVPVTSQVNANGIARLIEAMRIQQHVPDAKLVLSGGGMQPVPYAYVAGALAASIGFPKDRITVLGTALDTEQEATLLRREIGDRPFVLVTSAMHMPRSVALLRKQGLRPIPGPADFWATDAPGVSGWHLLPSARGIEKWNRALHEYVGYLWSALRGRI